MQEWNEEFIEDENLIFKRIHKNFIITHPEFPKIKEVPANIFNEPNKNWDKERLNLWDGISVDWNKYSTQEQTLERGRSESKNYGIIKGIVGDIRQIEPLSVKHKPIRNHPEWKDNRSHSLIKGILLANKVEIRMQLSKKCDWGILDWFK